MGGVILPSPNPIIGQFEKENGIPKGTGKLLIGCLTSNDLW